MSAHIRPILNRHWCVYKLTDENMQTYGGYPWKLGELRETSGSGALCGSGWLHVYSDPRIAVLLNLAHAAFQAPRLFEAVASGVYLSEGSIKAGVSQLTLVRELTLPVYAPNARIAFGALCVAKTLQAGCIPLWDTWATQGLITRDFRVGAAWAAEAAWAAGAAWAAEAAWAAGAARAAEAAGAARAARASPNSSLRAIADRVDRWVAGDTIPLREK